MGRSKLGVRQERLRITAEEICKRGTIGARHLLMRRWRIKRQTWDDYMRDCMELLRENNMAVLADKKAIAIARLERILALSTPVQAVPILREISKLEGLYSPTQIIQTNITPDDSVPDAVAEMMQDPKLLKAQIAATERNLKRD